MPEVQRSNRSGDNVSTLTIALTLPIYGAKRVLAVLQVEQALYRISAVTGQPVEAFYSEAMDWCASRVSSYEASLDFAYREVARGASLPWHEAQP
jgi:hypothetical protein